MVLDDRVENEGLQICREPRQLMKKSANHCISILLVEPEGTVTAVDALLEASVFADMSFPIMIHYCIDRKFSLKPMAVA